MPKPPKPKLTRSFFAATGSIGGLKSASVLTPAERKARARYAAVVRWGRVAKAAKRGGR